MIGGVVKEQPKDVATTRPKKLSLPTATCEPVKFCLFRQHEHAGAGGVHDPLDLLQSSSTRLSHNRKIYQRYRNSTSQFWDQVLSEYKNLQEILLY